MVRYLTDIILNKLLYIIMLIDLNKGFNFIIIIYVFIIYDYKFSKFIKLFWIPLFTIIITIFFISADMDDIWDWLKELFWYTKLLNISFLLHTCWLHWIYSFSIIDEKKFVE